MPTDNRAKFVAEVKVSLRAVVNDPQGLTVRDAAHALGYSEVGEVRVGKLIRLELGGASEEEVRERLRQLCTQLLCNGVIEEFQFSLERADQ